MNSTLAATALLMGLAGGPHCMAMCGATCGAVHQKKPLQTALFHLGRLIGYGVLGAVAASSVQMLGWLSAQTQVLRPLWSMLHLAAIALGLALLFTAKQPAFLETAARLMWQRIHLSKTWGTPTTFVVGLMWVFMPCGLLYSALLVAALGGSALGGTGVMLCFGVGSGLSLWLAPWLWRVFKEMRGQWGIRLAGLALVAISSWGLWLGLMHNGAPWC